MAANPRDEASTTYREIYALTIMLSALPKTPKIVSANRLKESLAEILRKQPKRYLGDDFRMDRLYSFPALTEGLIEPVVGGVTSSWSNDGYEIKPAILGEANRARREGIFTLQELKRLKQISLELRAAVPAKY